MSHPVYMVPAGDVLPIFFDTFDGGTGASITMTGLAVTDIEVYKDGGTTQRASDAGYTLLDTDGIDFDGLTGIHGFSIDTGDNTDSGFYAVGSWYHVVVSSVTVDGQTVSFVAAAFRIMAAEASAGVPAVNATHIGGTSQTGRDIGASVLLSNGTGTGQVSLASGVVSANAVQLSGDATAADNAEAFFDGTGYAGTNNVIPIVTAVTNAVSANVTQISGDSTAADNLETAFDDTDGPVPFMGIIDQGTAQSASATGLVLRSAAAFADDVLIGATLAVYGSTQGYWQTRTITDNALSGDTVTVDTWTVTPSGTITYKIFAGPPASATALPAVNVMQVGGSTTDVSALATNVAAILVDTGTTLDGKLNTIDDFLDTEIAAILADTNELQTDWANGGRLDLLLDGAASAGDPWTTTLPGAYGAGTAGYIVGSNLNAPVGTVDTVVDAIKAKTDSLTFTTANQIDARLVDGAHGGSSATLTMRKLTVSNTTNGDPAVAITASGTGNAHGVSVTASGGGKGVAIGAASVGLSIDSSAADAVQIQGGTDSDGLQVSGNGTGVDIRADITGNLTGNVSGSVGSVTATVDANILEVNSQGIGASKPYDTAT